ncbi:MAG: endonuclease III [Micavibrio aeruginosavorus]|uniref:Endonuclease III n=1 Tax=Micavibrio aeruginosavorus TaxID=349221 RepID=A0A2W5FR68_9BACT|nr:MAG: endonuclease III [Micavibrio aeruginosavorus]
MKQADIHQFFSRLRAQNPEPKGELEYVNPFTLLVAVVLSAQATDAGVNKATRGLFKKADTPAKMAKLGADGIKEYIKTVGLFNTKAENVFKLSNMLLDKYEGEIPKDRDLLTELPGVGRKTANVFLNIIHGEPTIAVDTHVFRVSNRTGLAPGNNVLEVEKKLEKVIPPEFIQHSHHWLILHGRYVCKARNPDCPNCVVNNICPIGKAWLKTGKVILPENEKKAA